MGGNTTLVYRGSEDGLPERVVTEVTRKQKTILGVPVVGVFDRVFLNGVLKEKTFDWYAQDTSSPNTRSSAPMKSCGRSAAASGVGIGEARGDGAAGKRREKISRLLPAELNPNLPLGPVIGEQVQDSC
ncbi:MAG: hypothetical protein ABIQ49_06070 [Gemmatimonadales bacterium]